MSQDTSIPVHDSIRKVQPLQISHIGLVHRSKDESLSAAEHLSNSTHISSTKAVGGWALAEEELTARKESLGFQSWKHITISRDQTDSRKNVEELTALKAVLDKQRGTLAGEIIPITRHEPLHSRLSPQAWTKVWTWLLSLDTPDPFSQPSDSALVNLGGDPFEGVDLYQIERELNNTVRVEMTIDSAGASVSSVLNEMGYHGRSVGLAGTGDAGTSGVNFHHFYHNTFPARYSHGGKVTGREHGPETPLLPPTLSPRPTKAFERSAAPSATLRAIGSSSSDGLAVSRTSDFGMGTSHVLDPQSRTMRRKASQTTTEMVASLATQLEALQMQLRCETGETEHYASNSSEPFAQTVLWRIVNRIRGKPYLGDPIWMHGVNGKIQLSATTPLVDIGNYLERHPQVQFLVFKDFGDGEHPVVGNKPDDDADLNKLVTPEPQTEAILLNTGTLDAVMQLTETFPGFSTVFPDADLTKEIRHPYYVFYYMWADWLDHADYLVQSSRELVLLLFEYLKKTLVPVYEDAVRHFGVSQLKPTHVQFFVKPNDIVVRMLPRPTAFMITTWARSMGIFHRKENSAGRKHRPPKQKLPSAGEPEGPTPEHFELWQWKAWNWVFEEGKLLKKETTLDLRIDVENTGCINFNSLEWFPLDYAHESTRKLLHDRGENYWRCRKRQLVGYASSAQDNFLNSGNERVMIDYAMYRKLHGEPNQRKNEEVREHDPADPLARNTMPTDGTINLFPATVVGYNLRAKKWLNIDVDRIREVNWNKTAFESLAIEHDTRHLIKALISTQLEANSSTDLISGKGNGLIMLLHGGPGTGKTFTAESVAEYVEKPLFRVTCGDIGTKPEEVEKYLETVLHLGKTWGCVVLLDEADVFLEERGTENLERNALVSVFLRVLEYYEGILILTSNRVGTFDSAFRSRIQLALHYEDLTRNQRSQVWSNFINRLEQLHAGDVGTAKQIDIADLRKHLEQFADHEMNGREIRNTITTARQLAKFDKTVLTHEQIMHVIGVAVKFDKYLRSLKKGFTAAQLLREDGIA